MQPQWTVTTPPLPRSLTKQAPHGVNLSDISSISLPRAKLPAKGEEDITKWHQLSLPTAICTFQYSPDSSEDWQLIAQAHLLLLSLLFLMSFKSELVLSQSLR